MKNFIRQTVCISVSITLSYIFFHSEPLATGIILAILLNVPFGGEDEKKVTEIKYKWILVAMLLGGIIILIGELVKFEIMTIVGIIILSLASALLVGTLF